MSVVLREEFHGRDTFFFAFVREHRAESTVAYDSDVRDFGAVFAVDDYAALVVGFEADFVKVEA